MAPDFDRTANSLQGFVDALSISLDRPVLLDDLDLEPLAYSRQWEVDTVRNESILSRGPTPQVRNRLLAAGIAEAVDALRIEAVPELGMGARVCIPVRRDGVLLAFLWLLASPAEPSAAELDRLREAARRIGAQLARRPEAETADEGVLLADLCSDSSGVRAGAVKLVRARSLLPEGSLVLCLVAAAQQDDSVIDAVRRVARRLSAGHVIAGRLGELGAVVAALRDPVLTVLEPAEVAAWVRVKGGIEAAVGRSQSTGLEGLADAARESRIALRVALARSPTNGTAGWETLGAERLVAQLPSAAAGDLPPRLRRLLESEPELVETLAVFLDGGGDVKGAAAALALHRSGFYYRLRRIEALTGLDLGDGDDRLLAHLALRAWKLQQRG